MLKPSHFPRKAFNSTEPSCLNCSTWWESAYCISLTLSIFPSSPLTFFHLSLHLSLSLSYHSSSYSTSFSIQFNLTHLICMNITWAKLSRYLNTTWTSLSLCPSFCSLSLFISVTCSLPSFHAQCRAALKKTWLKVSSSFCHWDEDKWGCEQNF